jgi:heme-degrading monooxygenase HmoA
MHGRMARYTYTGDAVELARKAEEGMLPIFQSQPGFKSYSLVESGGEVLSFSAWESAESADAAGALAAKWIAENIADQIEHKETKIGEILFATALGVSTKAGTTA